MRFKLFITLISFCICNLSCKDEINIVPKANKDYFILGIEYGRCIEDCVDYYKLEQDLILPDNTTNYHEKKQFFKDPINSSSLALFKYLSENIPTSIYKSDSLIGCVHCSDMGVIYVEKFKNGKLHKWQIDISHDPMPYDMKSFTKLAMIVVNKLNEERSQSNSSPVDY